MNALLSYQFDDEPVRIVMVAGEPWFVANDHCRALDIRNSRDALGRLEDDEKGVGSTDTPGGRQDINIISESGMYALVLGSRKESSRRFRKWVTAEVLPSLRKTGRYQMHDLEPPPVQAIDMDYVRMNAGVAVVREARRLFGPAAARNLWVQVGLPACVTDGEVVFDSDPLAAPLRAWLDTRQETTIQQALDAMGIADADWSTRGRVGKLLAMWGWTQRTRKVHRRAARVFTRPASSATIDQGEI